jgi:hypothetical protein
MSPAFVRQRLYRPVAGSSLAAALVETDPLVASSLSELGCGILELVHAMAPA